MAYNVRRYVALAQSRGGACFCTRGAMQGYDVVLFFLALVKTVTPGGGPRRGAGAGRTADHLIILFSLKILAVRSANDIYRPVTASFISSHLILDLSLTKSVQSLTHICLYLQR